MEGSGQVTSDHIAKLSTLVHLTRLDFIHQRSISNLHPAHYSINYASIFRLSQLKELQIIAKDDFVTRLNLEELCNSLPNLENLRLKVFDVMSQSPANISSLQYLTSLVIICGPCFTQLGISSCHNIHGIEKLTNLEVLELKICPYPDLSNLTRLRSLTYHVNCGILPMTAGQFIDHVANVPRLALEQFNITGVTAGSIQDNIARLTSLQTSLQETLVWDTDEKFRKIIHETISLQI